MAATSCLRSTDGCEGGFSLGKAFRKGSAWRTWKMWESLDTVDGWIFFQMCQRAPSRTNWGSLTVLLPLRSPCHQLELCSCCPLNVITTVDGSEIRLTTWYGQSTVIYRVWYILGGAGIFPSTLWHLKMLNKIVEIILSWGIVLGLLEVNISKAPLKKNTWVCKWSQRIQPAGSMWRDSAFVNALFDIQDIIHLNIHYINPESNLLNIYIYTVCISINCPQCFCNYPSIFRGWSHQFSAVSSVFE